MRAAAARRDVPEGTAQVSELRPALAIFAVPLAGGGRDSFPPFSILVLSASAPLIQSLREEYVEPRGEDGARGRVDVVLDAPQLDGPRVGVQHDERRARVAVAGLPHAADVDEHER